MSTPDNNPGGDLLDFLVGHVWTAPDGTEWRCERRFKKHVRARKISFPGYGTIAKVTDATGWRKHTLPKSVKRGDVLMHHGEPVVVTSFSRIGGITWVGLTGRWGSEDGHTHENLVPLYAEMVHDGYRLPFDGEEIRLSDANSDVFRHE